MKFLKPLLAAGAVVFFSGAHAAVDEESFQAAVQRGSAGQPSQYSFADVYRLTVSAPALTGFAVTPVNDAPIQVSAIQAPAQFSIAMPEPKPVLLLLSGLALALWIARRHLGNSF